MGTVNPNKLQSPNAPEGAPVHLEHLLDKLRHALEQDAPGTALRVIKETFDYLMELFCDLLESFCAGLGEQPEIKKTTTLALIQAHLKALSASAKKEQPDVQLLLGVFQNQGKYRAFAQLLGLGGRPRRGTTTLDNFVNAKQPPRRQCVQQVTNYLPHLAEWLTSASELFAFWGLLEERTYSDGQQSLKIQLSEHQVEAKKRLKVSGCQRCIPKHEILVPPNYFQNGMYLFVPQRVPTFLNKILEELEKQLAAQEAAECCRQLSRALEFLIRYFAGVAAGVCRELKVLPKECQLLMEGHRSLSKSESLLNICLETLRRQPDSDAAMSITEVFFQRNDLYDFIPRWHTEMLALRGQLSGWCQLEPGKGELQDPEVCRLEFENHVLVLAEWLRALGGYLAETEHFFEKPRENGSIDFSLRIGNRFVEIAEPNYLLWLNNPRVEGEALDDDSSFKPPLITEPIIIPEKAPQVLTRILTRMDIFLRRGESVEACTSLRDAMDYLTRYYAGLTVAAYKQLGDVPEEITQMAQSSLSVHQCEKLLLRALEFIGTASDEKLGVAIREVFYYTETFSQSEKPTGAHTRLLILDADTSNNIQYIADFCALKPGEGVLSHPTRSQREIERFLPALRDWLAMSEPLFNQCKHFEEKPASDGQTELVIEFNDIYLELVKPDYVFYILPGSDEVPDLEAPELPVFDDQFEQEMAEMGQRRSKRFSATERPFLVHRVEQIGMRENSQGVKCLAGYIVLTNAGGGSLSGEAVSTDRVAIEVEPRRFRGNKVQLSYWVDEGEVPETHEVFIELKTAQGVRSVSIFELTGKEKGRAAGATSGMALMLVPTLVLFPFFLISFLLLSQYMHNYLTDEITGQYVLQNLYRDAPEVVDYLAQFCRPVGYLYLLMAGIVPYWVGRIYRSFKPSTQQLLERQRRLPMVLPTLLVGPLLLTPILSNHFTSDPDFKSVHLTSMFLYFVFLNLGGTYYQELSLEERFDDLLVDKNLAKKLPPALALFVFLCVLLTGVSF